MKKSIQSTEKNSRENMLPINETDMELAHISHSKLKHKHTSKLKEVLEIHVDLITASDSLSETKLINSNQEMRTAVKAAEPYIENIKKLTQLLQLTILCKYNQTILTTIDLLPLIGIQAQIAHLNKTLKDIFSTNTPGIKQYEDVVTERERIMKATEDSSRAATPSALVTAPPAQTPITAEIVKQIIDDTKDALDKKKQETLKAISDQQENIKNHIPGNDDELKKITLPVTTKLQSLLEH